MDKLSKNSNNEGILWLNSCCFLQSSVYVLFYRPISYLKWAFPHESGMPVRWQGTEKKMKNKPNKCDLQVNNQNHKNWEDKIVTPEEVLAKIVPGMSIFIGTGVSEPRTLVKELMGSTKETCKIWSWFRLSASVMRFPLKNYGIKNTV